MILKMNKRFQRKVTRDSSIYLLSSLRRNLAWYIATMPKIEDMLDSRPYL